MAFERLKTEIGILLTDLEGEPPPHDKQELQLQLLRKLNEMRSFGMPLPEDLVALEEALEAELAADRGRG